MPVTDLDPESAKVVRWREERLERAGYDPELASELAERGDVDLHLAVELIERGCAPEIAARILR